MLDIVIVNWNSGRQLTELLASIMDNHHGLVASVIIVDNASQDGSSDHLDSGHENYPFALHVIRNQENRGFAAACNQGAQLATGDYLLFLNPDTRLFADSLTLPYAFMQEKENCKVGAVGIQLVDEAGHISRTCARFPTLGMFEAQLFGLNRWRPFRHLNIHMVDWPHDETAEVDHVIGAFYWVRRSLFEIVGGFDERFFVYLEDLDLSLRIRRAGYRIVFLAGPHAFHAGGGVSRQVKALRLYYSLRSRVIYGYKHFPLWQARVLLAMTLLIEPFIRTLYSLIGNGGKDVWNTWRAYGFLWRRIWNDLKVNG